MQTGSNCRKKNLYNSRPPGAVRRLASGVDKFKNQQLTFCFGVELVDMNLLFLPFGFKNINLQASSCLQDCGYITFVRFNYQINLCIYLLKHFALADAPISRVMAS